MRAALAFIALVAACTGGEIDQALQENPPPGAEPNVGCAKTCHGSESTNAPPVGITGDTETSAVGVGAHGSHLTASPTWHRKVDCADCHVVPARDSDPGHLDGDGKAEVTFAAIAGAGAAWNGTTCTTRCHGQTAWGGTHTVPTWTQVDGTQAACGSCHGAPPPAPHPAVTNNNCAACHPTMEENSLTFRDPASHINGVIDLSDSVSTGGCTTCHGTAATNAAPPLDLAGNTARTEAGVGAHQQHLAASNWHRAVVCSDCHTVPTTLDAPGHRDGDNVAEVIFGALNPTATYVGGTTTCTNLYCHGNGRGNNGALSWVATGALQCGNCHNVNGTNMSGRHNRHINEENMECSECHQTVVNAQRVIVNANLHVNGVHEVKMAQGTWNPNTRQCSNTGCHNTKSW